MNIFGDRASLHILVFFMLMNLTYAVDNKLWFEKPATSWEKEALPIGNGRLGAMIFGGIERERIQFNEDTLWIGDESDTGAFQAFGDLFIDFETKPVTNYRRELDLGRAVHTVTYSSEGVNYKREYFASNPAGVLVFHFTADKQGSLNGSLSLADAHKGTATVDSDELTIKGSLNGYVHSLSKDRTSYDIALNYEVRVQVRHTGGTLQVHEGKIIFKDVDELTLYLDAGTDYINQRAKKWRGESPQKTISKRLAKAAATNYAELLGAHVKDYQALFGRVSVNVGETAPEISKLPTDRRLNAYRGGEQSEKKGSVYEGHADNPLMQGVPDPELEVLLFQFARYLMISCSRPGDLPANLQGIWNESNDPMWRSDYHANVNVQMNYWFVDAANIGETFQPFSEWLHSVIPVRREETKRELGVRGWATRWENGIFGGATCPWSMGDAAWLAQNIWDHYAFSQDKRYLKTRAYPVLKELCEFWEDSLKEGPDGKLVGPPSKSPEHGPVASGNSYDQQLVYDLFSNYIEAANVLGVDKAYRAKIENLRSRLLGPKIGKWGQLQEWAEDIDDPKDTHRHFSHMIAVYPGRQISPISTPELAEAARVSMNARGDASTGWSRAWKICVWARLHDGDRALSILRGMVRTSFTPNLLATHPPFQIDANFGYAAGVCELLLQSHAGAVHLLPALPKSWASGSVQGLRARGNITVDMEWKEGKVTRCRISSPEPRPISIIINGETKRILPELSR